MKITTVNEIWFEGNWSSGYTIWLLSLMEFEYKTNKSMTKLVLLTLLEYQVETY